MIAVLLGWSLLGESIPATRLLGAAIIVTSVWFIVRSTRRPAAASSGGVPDAAVASAGRRV